MNPTSCMKKLLPALLAVTVSAWCSLRLGADSSFAPNHSLSWSSNLGWLDWSGDLDHGVHIDQFVCSGFIYSANVGCINLGNGLPANGMSYQNNSSSDFGVNVGPHGELTGFAYAANVGWINFSPAGQPHLDLKTGTLGGYVYGANVGWIGLGDAANTLRIDFLDEGTDSDGDGIPDIWELSHADNLGQLGSNHDLDGDGFSDLEEYLADTDPTDPTDNLRILKFSISSDRSSVFISWSARPTRQYVIQSKSTLDPAEPWIDSGLGILSTEAPSLSVEFSRPVTGIQQYYWIRAIRPLAN